MDAYTPTPPIQTERLVLRNWCGDDREAFAAMCADPWVMAYLPALTGESEIQATLDRFASHHERHGFGFWVLEERATGIFAGFAGLQVVSFQAHFTPAVEIGWRLPVAFWGKGLANEAARACLDYGFNTLSLSEIVAFTAPGNRRSRALMGRLGMRHDPAGDFIHPALPADHPLQPCVLYRIANPLTTKDRTT